MSTSWTDSWFLHEVMSTTTDELIYQLSTPPSTTTSASASTSTPLIYFSYHIYFYCDFYCHCDFTSSTPSTEHANRQHFVRNVREEEQQLSRDQEVVIITSDQCEDSADCEYKCFYCQVQASLYTPVRSPVWKLVVSYKSCMKPSPRQTCGVAYL